jgi:hypothetical protein
MSDVNQNLLLARNAITCSVCFAGGQLQRAGIRMAQPFTIGSEYKPGGTAVVSINPGASSDNGYKEARMQALTRFAAGSDAALLEYWSALAEDAVAYWNPRYLTRLRALGLDIARIVVGNIALCATDGNKYPRWMLQRCWNTHSFPMLETLRPKVVILMGSEGVMQNFESALNIGTAGRRVVRMAHFAHREGNAFEAAECERVKAILNIAAEDRRLDGG